MLDSFVIVAPYINKLTNSDLAISVCDLEKCLIYIPSEKQDHKIEMGNPHVKNSVSYESITTRKRVVKRVDSELFGFSYIAIAIPIEDEIGNIVGSVAFTEAVDRQDLLLALADNLHDTMQQMLSVTEIISDNSLKLKEIGENFSNITKISMSKVNETEDILKSIKSISNKANKLGINAYIDAISIGSKGEEFKIVAEEISNLSNSTNDYIKNAEKVIEDLKLSTGMIVERLEDILNVSSNQIKINNYISGLVMDINERCEKLKENARLLSE